MMLIFWTKQTDEKLLRDGMYLKCEIAVDEVPLTLLLCNITGREFSRKIE